MALSYLRHTHNLVWSIKCGKVKLTCRCGAVSPVFDELAEWQLVVAWVNEHGREETSS